MGPGRHEQRIRAFVCAVLRDSTGRSDRHTERDVELEFFTTLTTLDTPMDVTAQELRIESYFPADEATGEWLRKAAALAAN